MTHSSAPYLDADRDACVWCVVAAAATVAAPLHTYTMHARTHGVYVYRTLPHTRRPTQAASLHATLLWWADWGW